jgi:hypothetical protein
MAVIITFFLLITIITAKIWKPEDLAKEVKEYNSLIDPEGFLIEEYDLAEIINNNYLQTNKIYDKVDINVFVVAGLHYDYAYKNSKFADELMERLEESTEIDHSKKKSSYLTIIYVARQQFVIFKPSEKLEKLLPSDFIKEMTPAIIKIIQSKRYKEAIVFTFKILNIIFEKFKKNSTNSSNNTTQDLINNLDKGVEYQYYFISALILILLIVFLVLGKIYIEKKEYFQTIKYN